MMTSHRLGNFGNTMWYKRGLSLMEIQISLTLVLSFTDEENEGHGNALILINIASPGPDLGLLVSIQLLFMEEAH